MLASGQLKRRFRQPGREGFRRFGPIGEASGAASLPLERILRLRWFPQIREEAMRQAAFDEMNGHGESQAPGPRSAYNLLKRWLSETSSEILDARRSQAELLFRRIGITFAVYGETDADERLIPFDIIPRILTGPNGRGSSAASSSASRRSTSSSPTSTARAESSRPASSRPTSSTATRISGRRWPGVEVPHDIYVHIAGIDIVRVDEDDFLRPRGQCPHAVRRLLHAGEPRGDDAALPGAVRRAPRRPGRELSRRAARDAALGRARGPRPATRPSRC